MRVVIGTNVVVSAILKDRIPEEVVLFVLSNAAFEWVASPEILSEYIGVLRRRKFGLPQDLLRRWEALLGRLITVIQVTDVPEFVRDPKDAPFLACALSAGAEYLITGDKDFTEAYKAMNTTVLSVSQFKRLICDRW